MNPEQVRELIAAQLAVEWEKANAIHDSHAVALQAVAGSIKVVADHVTTIGATVESVKRSVDYLETEARNGGIRARVRMPTSIKAAIIAALATVSAAVIAAFAAHWT